MAWLTTHCPACGSVDVPVGDVVLRVRDEVALEVAGGLCLIRCPSCDVRFGKVADAPMTALLLAVGIAVSVWPVGGPDPGEDGRDLITHDELVAWRAALDDDEQIADALLTW